MAVKKPLPVSGRVRGVDIHLACASSAENRLTWAAFWRPDDQRLGLCERCGQPLNRTSTNPQPPREETT
ncbi:hypothetical protein [Mycobacterium sp.]|uniref:hypothetical protein n=1 Tax=Mycobacterium sp. TaxID=1785 RepID=UPI00261ED910|nr:hypothetical protein [Mycobacterium sp.]